VSENPHHITITHFNCSSFKNDSELFGRTIRVNLAKPQKIREGSSRPVWADDSWLQEHAGQTLKNDQGDSTSETPEGETKVSIKCWITNFSLLPPLVTGITYTLLQNIY